MVGTNVCGWRVRESLVQKGDDLLVEHLVLWRVLGNTAEDAEDFCELHTGVFSTQAIVEKRPVKGIPLEYGRRYHRYHRGWSVF